MRETPLSNVEKKFVLDCIKRKLRLDGRDLYDFRPLKINFGSEWGSAHVTLGETRVLAQVTCELGEPKATHPNEGLLYINVELGPMAAVNFERGRSSELTVQINRILERTFKDSRCVDLESLCVTAEDKVWILRVYLNVLNHEGNIIDCASVATLCALAHFRRPDVTVSEKEIKIHTSAEKDPIPIVLHHYPVCISFATFHDGEKAISDPTFIEERCSEANMVFGFNSYREVCCISLGGTTLTSTNLFLQCAHEAAKRARIVVEQVKMVLAKDADAKSNGKSTGFSECLSLDGINSEAKYRLALKLPNFDLDTAKNREEPSNNVNEITEIKENLVETKDNISILNSAQANIKWVPESDTSNTDYSMDSESDDEVPNDEINFKETASSSSVNKSCYLSKKMSTEDNSKEQNETSSDSEEDVIILG